MRSSVPPSFFGVQRPCALQIFRRVDGGGGPGTDRHLDRMPVVERAELLQTLGALELGLRQLGKSIQEGRGESVHTEVRERLQLALGARVGNEAAGEVERA